MDVEILKGLLTLINNYKDRLKHTLVQFEEAGRFLESERGTMPISVWGHEEELTQIKFQLQRLMSENPKRMVRLSDFNLIDLDKEPKFYLDIYLIVYEGSFYITLDECEFHASLSSLVNKFNNDFNTSRGFLAEVEKDNPDALVFYSSVCAFGIVLPENSNIKSCQLTSYEGENPISLELFQGQRYETGKPTPSSKVSLEFKDVFDFSLHSLFEEHSPEQASQHIADIENLERKLQNKFHISLLNRLDVIFKPQRLIEQDLPREILWHIGSFISPQDDKTYYQGSSSPRKKLCP